jgi:PAS domain S-box-containing protein
MASHPPTPSAFDAASLATEVVDLLHESVVVRDMDGRVVAWNAASERLYGWSREQLVGEVAEHRWHSAPAAVRESGERQVLLAGSWDGELQRSDAAGRTIEVEVRWALRRDARGGPAHVVETARDIGERRRVEAALRDNEQRYRNLFGAMAASFWELDFTGVGELLRALRKSGVSDFASYFDSHPELCRSMIGATRIVDVNDETVRLFGRGNKVDLLADLNAFWPDESLHVYAASVLAAVGGQPHFRREARMRRLDGSTFEALFTACFAPDAVARGRLLIGVIDISERQRVLASP